MKYSEDQIIMQLQNKIGRKRFSKWICLFNIDDYIDECFFRGNLKDIVPQKINIILDKDYKDCIIFKGKNAEHIEKLDVHYDLMFFDTKEECIEYYNSEIYHALKNVRLIFDNVTKFIEENENKFIKSNYLMEKLRRG